MAKIKQKPVKKINKSKDLSGYKRALIIFSISLNIAFIIVGIIAWADWATGNVNNLTGAQLQSTCTNFFRNEKNVPTGKSVVVGDITFIPSYLNNNELNSQCTSLVQAYIFARLVQSNNSAAINYYDNLTNFHPPSLNNLPNQIPIDYSQATGKPTIQPY